MKEKVGLIALGSRDDFDKWDDVVSLLAPEIEELFGYGDAMGI